jgi:GAF domain-containing protein
MLLDRESQELVVTSAKGRHAVDDVLGARARVGEGVAGWVAEHQEPLILGEVVDARRYQSFRPKPNAPTASMIVPITARGELVGVLNVGNHAPGTRYVDEDVHALMVFAENAGICCRHAEQSEWMRQTIRRLDSELAARDRIRAERAA